MAQSAQFDAYRRRVVVPLARASRIGKISFAAFNPTFKIRGVSVVLHPLEIVSVPLDQLGDLVGSLGEESQLVVAALDELLTRAWQ
jgi:toxin CcdB